MAVDVSEQPGGFKSLTVIIRADRWSEVIAKRDEYLKRWDPQGYGTSFSEPKRADGQTICYGYRSTSCD